MNHLTGAKAPGLQWVKSAPKAALQYLPDGHASRCAPRLPGKTDLLPSNCFIFIRNRSGRETGFEPGKFLDSKAGPAMVRRLENRITAPTASRQFHRDGIIEWQNQTHC